MTDSPPRRAFILVRGLALLAILLAFLSPLGVSAQDPGDDASPVPPEATATVAPTMPPVEATQPPTEEAVPSATVELPGTPEVTPTETPEFDAAGIRSAGFMPPIAFAFPGQIVGISFGIDMESTTEGGTITFDAPTQVGFGAPNIYSSPGSTCTLVNASGGEITATFSSIGTGFCSFSMTGLISGSAVVGSTLIVTAAGGTTTEPGAIDSSFTITVGVPGTPSLTLGLSRDEVFVSSVTYVTAVLYDPGATVGSGNITISLGAPGAEVLIGSEQAFCSPTCTIFPTWLSQPNSSTLTYTPDPLIPTTLSFSFAIGVPSSTMPGTSVAINASGSTVLGVPVNATPVNLSVVEDPSPPMGIGFSSMVVEPGQSVNVNASYMSSPSSGGTGSIEVDLPNGVTLVPGSAQLYCGECAPMVTEGAGSVSGTFSGALSTPTTVGLGFTIVIDANVVPGTLVEFTGSGTMQNGTSTDPASGVLSVVAPGSAPRMQVSIDNPLPVVGDRITVTVTTNDPSSPISNPGFVQSFVSSYATYVDGSATITCSPDCATDPSVSFTSGQITGTYTSTLDTTTTVTTTYQVDISGIAYPGTQIYFYASGSVASGVAIQADPVMATVQQSTVVGPLVVTLDDQTVEPGQTIQVNAIILEPSTIGTELGYLQLTVPDGTTLVPGSAFIYCQICPEEPTTSSSMVSGHYTGIPGQTNAVTLGFLVTVSDDVAPGTTLTFTGSGTDSFGEAIPASSAMATVIELGSEPSASISLSQSTASPDDTVTVTVTFYDPSASIVTSGGVTVYLPFGVEASSTPGTITCDPECLAPPSVSSAFGAINGSYTPVLPGPTTVTMTFDVVLTNVYNGQTIPFTAGGTGADGRFDSSLTTLLAVAIPGVPVTITASDTDPAPGDIVTITAMQEEGSPGGPGGYLDVTVPYGASVVPGSAVFSGCASCDGGFDEYSQGVAAYYQNITGDSGPTGVTFEIVIGEDTPSGTPLEIVGTGYLANGAFSGPGSVTLTVHGELATSQLKFDAEAGQATLGDLNDGVSGGIPPYTFALVTQPTQGSIVVNDDGTFRYIADADASGLDSFTYSVTDSAATPDSRVSGAAAVTGDVFLAFPDVTPTPTVEPGATPAAEPTMAPGGDASGVTKLPNTGQGADGNSDSNAIVLATLLMTGVVLFGLATSRVRRR